MSKTDGTGTIHMRDYYCPACENRCTNIGTSAVVSPWVLELAGVLKKITPKYVICEKCGSGWFTNTYTEEILNALYKEYRGEHYFLIRNSWESTYTKELNEGLNNGQSWLDGRRFQIERSIKQAGYDPQKMESVLDFGGGHGGVMPKFPHRYLMEANESVKPEPGITLIRKWDEAKLLDLDLVMCCGVLEHLNEPMSVVRKILELNAEVYLFEVPTGTPVKRAGLVRFSLILKLLASNKSIWRSIQKIERRTKLKWRKFFPLRCSEHLQFFTLVGLFELLSRCGLEVLELTETTPNDSLTDSAGLGFQVGLIAVCRKKF